MNELTLIRIAKQAMLHPIYPNPRFPPSPYYRFLKLLAKELQSRLSVELGVCGGGGSLHMAMTSQIAVGVDHVFDPVYEENITHIIHNYPNFYFLQGDSVGLAGEIYQRWGPIDLLFIDTTHTYEQTMIEYNTYQSYLSGKAIVCLDDLFRPGMIDAWNEMPETKVRLDFLHQAQKGQGQTGDGGFGVVWK